MKEEKSYPLISVVMPIYNSAKFLRKSIPAVLGQEYPNLEIVLLNNGSTDESWAIIDEYAKQDGRIEVYTIEHVGTPKESRDNAIYRAKGEWVISVDSDDEIEFGYVEKLWKRHEETGADCVCGIMVFGDENVKSIVTTPKDTFDISVVFTGTEAMLHTLFEWEIGLNGTLWKKEILTTTNLFTLPKRRFYTDECDGRIQLHACKKVAITDAKYYYFCHSDSTGQKSSVVKITYNLMTYLGLYQYFVSRYGKESVLSFGCLIKLNRAYRNAIKRLICNRRMARIQMNETHRECIQDVYSILYKRKKDIGLVNCYENIFVHFCYTILI